MVGPVMFLRVGPEEAAAIAMKELQLRNISRSMMPTRSRIHSNLADDFPVPKASGTSWSTTLGFRSKYLNLPCREGHKLSNKSKKIRGKNPTTIAVRLGSTSHD
jgi:hypothetical protein